MKHFFGKLRIAFKIVSGKYKHCVIISVDTANGQKMMNDEQYDIQYAWLWLHKHAVHKLLKGAASLKDDVDMILDKAQMQADFIDSNKENK